MIRRTSFLLTVLCLLGLALNACGPTQGRESSVPTEVKVAETDGGKAAELAQGQAPSEAALTEKDGGKAVEEAKGEAPK